MVGAIGVGCGSGTAPNQTLQRTGETAAVCHATVQAEVGCSSAPAAERERYRAKQSLASLARCKSLSGKV
jgi:hypothetical protein